LKKEGRPKKKRIKGLQQGEEKSGARAVGESTESSHFKIGEKRRKTLLGKKCNLGEKGWKLMKRNCKGGRSQGP